MKIEKISDNQVRCTLSHEDLLAHELRISELAYGSDKTLDLFRDMLQRAASECDFDTEDMPLMIEAIPVSADCLVLLITKCTDLDELDTRFSNFTSAPESSESPAPMQDDRVYADEILSCFEHLSDVLGDQLSSRLLGDEPTPDKSIRTGESIGSEDSPLIRNLSKVYAFDSLETVISISHTINRFYHGENTLFKNPDDGVYYLVVNLSEHTAGEFNKVCNILSDYGRACKVPPAGILHFEEHFEVIVRNKATQILSKM